MKIILFMFANCSEYCINTVLAVGLGMAVLLLPGLRSSLMLDGESMRSKASAASMVLSEQWTLVPWTEASTETQTQNNLANTVTTK